MLNSPIHVPGVLSHLFLSALVPFMDMVEFSVDKCYMLLVLLISKYIVFWSQHKSHCVLISVSLCSLLIMLNN